MERVFAAMVGDVGDSRSMRPDDRDGVALLLSRWTQRRLGARGRRRVDRWPRPGPALSDSRFDAGLSARGQISERAHLRMAARSGEPGPGRGARGLCYLVYT